MYKKCSTCKELKLFENFSKSKAKRDGYHNQCKICVKHYKEVNKEQIAGYMKQYRESNKDQISEHRKQYYETNKEQYQQYYEANKKRFAEYQKQYCENNPTKINARNAKRRATKLNATPNWLTPEEIQQIEDFYKEAQALKLATGQDYHVDHIVPLQGENICGLHVPWNLQILEASENIRKSNKLLEN